MVSFGFIPILIPMAIDPWPRARLLAARASSPRECRGDGERAEPAAGEALAPGEAGAHLDRGRIDGFGRKMESGDLRWGVFSNPPKRCVCVFVSLLVSGKKDKKTHTHTNSYGHGIV